MNEDDMKFYLWVRHDLKGTSSVRESTVTEISEIVAAKLEQL
jgi:hypothetical protein